MSAVQRSHSGLPLLRRSSLLPAVESLRKQASLLRGQLGRDRVLRSMQLPAP